MCAEALTPFPYEGSCNQTLDPIVLGLGFGSGSEPKFFLGLANSEFNSIQFGAEIKKKKFYEFQKFLGLTNSEFNSIHFGVEINKKKFYECQKFFVSKIFKKNKKKFFNPVFHTGAHVHYHFECQYLLK